MREILFRAKRPDGGAWVEGFLAKLYGEYSIIIDQKRVKSVLPIVPETICQYTGLTDRNGKKIFEGDVLKGEEYPFCCDGEYNYFAEIVWFENSPAFGICTIKNPESNVNGISHGNCEYIEEFSNKNWEVIGNIYDNPELLKGGAE